jgi:hypothetical protein
LKHGARSEAALVPLAEQIFTKLLEDPAMPDHVRSPAFLMEGAAWSRAEAAAALLWRHIGEVGIEAATRLDPGRVRSLMDIWMSAERTAGSFRSKLGLNPVAYSGIARDLGIGARASEDALERLSAQGRAIVARRGELEAGG